MLTYYAPGVMPVRRHLDNGADSNPDGHGYAIITADNKLLTGKSMFSASLIDEFMALRGLHPQGPAMFHSRISTSGRVDLSGCHPFAAGGDPETVIGHNGILFRPDPADGRSDTRIFAEDIFPRTYRRLDRDKTRKDLHEYLYGKGSFYPNKMLILTVNPRYRYGAYLFGAHKGDWVVGDNDVRDDQVPGAAWHSNSGWKYEAWHPYTGGAWKGGSWKSDETAWWDACQFCGEAQKVDPDTAICMACGICTDCGTDQYQCMCYVPLRLRIGASQ